MSLSLGCESFPRDLNLVKYSLVLENMRLIDGRELFDHGRTERRTTKIGADDPG